MGLKWVISLREARHNRNRLQANGVSAAGGETASHPQRPKGVTA